ncbi:MAG: hypothetical protein IH944_13435 [Armatimonadetes bacterium]|nr:hypothetical protein [Armatimonadota bacterium]
MEEFCRSQTAALNELENLAPGAPFLALGQTVFWDEPLKIGVIQAGHRLGFRRKFVCGIHDTDYFAKYSHRSIKTGYHALPHNDTTTKAIWSAAGEFSALFGSETVIGRDRLAAAGGKVARIAHARPGYLEGITEAWGWRGVVSYEPSSRTTADTALSRLFDPLYDTLEWAIDESLECIAGDERARAVAVGEGLKGIACDAADDRQNLNLADYYAKLAPILYGEVSKSEVDLEVTKTTVLLRLNSGTCDLPRFRILNLFIDPNTRDAACKAYDETIEGTEIYPLSRFGAGALPFDVYIPGRGRGTLKLGKRGGVVMTTEPIGFSFKKPLKNVSDLARVLERKFGEDVVVVGKAVTLIGMLAAEFVFVFHEGASNYVKYSRLLHQKLSAAGLDLSLKPILRVRYEPWDALIECKSWFRLPPPLRGPFGVDELSAESFAKRWRGVADEQTSLLAKLAELRRPLELFQFLDSHLAGQWSSLSAEYDSINASMLSLNAEVGEIKDRRSELVQRTKRLREQRSIAEVEKGAHWRANIFERSPTQAEFDERERLTHEVSRVAKEIERAKKDWRDLKAEQDALVNSPEVLRSGDRRKAIAFEAELMRLKLIREAVIATDGLRNAGHRPSAWWFPLVSPDGRWYEATMRRAFYYLEHLR